MIKNKLEKLKEMIRDVALLLGPKTLSEIAFVGGCTTCLYMTDSISNESVRYTFDVDLIIDIMGLAQWTTFQAEMRAKGFTEPIDDEDAHICRMNHKELKVDFMPTDEKILGFSNRWYKEALKTAMPYSLTKDLSIKILTPPFFIATKFEAYQGRGKNDPVASNDIEDILNVVDGREELTTEIENANEDVKKYIAQQVNGLLENDDIHHAVQSQTANSPGRNELIYERLENMGKMA